MQKYSTASTKPRLLISTDGYLPRWDGITRFLSELIPVLQLWFDVTVIAPRFKGTAPDIPGVNVIRLPLLPFKFGDIRFSRFKRSLVRKAVAQADVVFNQSIGPVGVMTISAAYKQGVPVASFTHSIDWELAAKSIKHFRKISAEIVRWLSKKLYNKCTMLIIPGEDIAMLLQSIGVTTPMRKVPLGVDTQHFKPPLSRPRAKKHIGIDQRKTVIGFVGRLAREKNLKTLQRAFDTMHKAHPDTHLLIVGDGLHDEIKKGKDVTVTGMVDDVVPYFQAMDIYVSPSLTETSSLATMEAMACGLPVIVTAVGSIPEYVRHQKNGWFFGRRDFEDLARKITYLLDRTALRGKLGFAARKTIEREFRWETTAQNIRKLLLLIIKKNSPAAKRPGSEGEEMLEGRDQDER